VSAPAPVVERLGAGDGPRLRAVRLRALAEDPEAFYRTFAEEEGHPDEHWERWVASPRGAVLVARAADGTDVGVAALVPDRHDAAGLALVTVWVSASARGTGTGRALVEHLLQIAREQDVRSVTLEVADDNLAAVRLYDDLGFVPTGHTGAFAPPREHVTEHERRLVLRPPTPPV
jgi:ribosomal protein S18 acetylase RimI-like enzyme